MAQKPINNKSLVPAADLLIKMSKLVKLNQAICHFQTLQLAYHFLASHISALKIQRPEYESHNESQLKFKSFFKSILNEN
jgi:hypothetical protein